MRTSRRGFFGLLGGAVLLWGGAPGAGARETALGVHRATRNTLRRAVGARLAHGPLLPPYKSYGAVRRVALPDVASERGVPLAAVLPRYGEALTFGKPPLSLRELARLLHFGNGVTGRRRRVPLRAAPSAGALYAVEVYVAVQNVLGLAPGLYYYDVLRHELAELRSGAPGDALAGAVERPEALRTAAAVVLLSSVFERYTQRYANRGYRYALIDSGHVGENLRLASVSAGLSETSPLRFHDDALHALLGLDGRAEAVCAVHAFGRSGGRPAAGERPQSGLRESQDQSPAVSWPGNAIERYHAATKLVPANPRARAAPGPLVSADRAQDGVELPVDPPPPMSVEQAIAERRSATRFRARPMGRAQLGFVLAAAGAHDRLVRAPGVELHVVVHRVEGLAAGLYACDPRNGRLFVTQARDLSGALRRACLSQPKAATAAAVLLMVGRLADAARRGGERSYRDLLLEAGGIAQRIYLAAEACGLVARNLAAFVDGDLNALLGWDGLERAVVHLTVLGHGS